MAHPVHSGHRWLLPHTRRGRWSLGLLGGSLLLLAAFFALVASGQRGGDTFFSNMWLSGTILPAAALAIAAGSIGVVAVIDDHERSVGVFAAIGFGLLVLLFAGGEILFPH